MGKWIRRILMAVLLLVFCVSLAGVLLIRRDYRVSDALYASAAEQFTQPAPQAAPVPVSGGSGEPAQPQAAAPEKEEAGEEAGEENGTEALLPPVRVDFDALLAVNPDVEGWLYCEGTVINYPLMHGENDDVYLRRAYDGSYSWTGSLFTEADNLRDFADSNTIIYGHNMRNNTMFANLTNWAQEGYYEEHPVMWLLTPERDYRVLLFSGYATSAYSETFTIFPAPSRALDKYLENARALSDFDSEVEIDSTGRFVVMSTCAYLFDYSRYVLHGMLEPVESAGGVPLND